MDWLSKLIEVNDSSLAGPPARSQQSRAPKRSSKARLSRSSPGTNPSSLVAQPSEEAAAAAAAGAGSRRRGSGSGLALMRSLSASAGSPGFKQQASESPTSSGSSTPRAPAPQQPSNKDELEDARNDLKAAFCVFDLDGDGYITLDEVRVGLKLLGESWSPGELSRVFSKCSSSSSSNSSSADLNEQRISIDDFVQLLL